MTSTGTGWTTSSPSTKPATLGLHLGQGSGNFSSLSLVQVGTFNGVINLHVTDVDGDSNVDVIIGRYIAPLWIEIGQGGTTTSTVLPLSPGFVFTSGDMDADVDLDLVCAPVANERPGWYENLGGGNFGAFTGAAGSSTPLSTVTPPRPE